MEAKRLKLDTAQAESLDLVVTGKMTDVEFFKLRRALDEISIAIDDKQSLVNIFQSKLDSLPQKQSAIQAGINSSLTKLRRHAAMTLADEIARIAGSEIKDLMALLPTLSNNPLGCDPFSEVGHWVASSIYGGLPASPLRPLPADDKKLIQNTLERLGVVSA
jgi:hypothetical protein